TAGEDNFHLLFEAGSICHVVSRNNATAKEADVREHVQMLQRDAVGFHAAHGQTSHPTMWLICDGAEIGVDERNQFIHQHRFKRGIAAEPSPAAESATSGTARRTVRA